MDIPKEICTPVSSQLKDQTPSLFLRYTAKLGSNIFGMLFNFINVSLVPRTLGPASYGNYEYFLSFFQQITGFIDTGTSAAFYNKLAQRNADLGLIRTYSKFVALVFVVIVLGLAVAWALGLKDVIWPGQDWQFILLAAGLCYLMWVQEVVRKMIDAYGCTIPGEFASVAARTAGVLAIVVLFLGSWLTLTTLFLKDLVFYLAMTALLGWIVIKHWRLHLRASAHATSGAMVVTELWTYCSPLLIYAFAGVVAGLADRWLLQRYSGSAEQGFYSLALRVAGISFVFTSAMTQLIMREYSIAHGQDDLEQTRRLFKRYVPMLFTLTAYFAAFISMQAETVIWILGGKSFAAAGPAMMLMAMYPVHQTYGQMNGALLFATGKTRLYRNIGVAAMVTGLILTWGLLAPSSEGGLAAGSLGLAIKMVFLQLVAVNIQLWFNLKDIGLKFRFYMLHQVGVVAGLLLLAWLATTAVAAFGMGRLGGFALSGMAYTLFASIAIWQLPVMVGATRADFDSLVKKFLPLVAGK